MDGIQDLLRRTFETQNDLTLVIPGTGTAAMEAAIVNLVEPGDRVLACVIGFFGQRMAEIAARCGAEVRLLEAPWGQALPAERIRHELDQHPAKVITIVHAETSTGVAQPLDEIAHTAEARGALLVVDAVTSAGGVPVGVDRLGLDICYAAAQKCIGGPPGVAPITVGARALASIKQRRQPARSLYLDLLGLQEYWSPERAYHHTTPVLSCYGLYEALRLVGEEGLEERWSRHRETAELLWAGLESMGLRFFAAQDVRLPMLTAVHVPDGVEDMPVRQRLLADYNIEIGGGFGKLKGKIWRIGLMGHSCRKENVVLLLSALEHLLRDESSGRTAGKRHSLSS
jgi:alanine-glyoxylate transaminase/serine-glyoxylate transaminase/serine-pyruvate transaminase